MIGYRFLLPAEEEMTGASLFYEAATLGLGAEFLAEVGPVINILRDHPELGRPIGRGLRRTLLHCFPFCLIYFVEVDTVVIVAVAHQRRRPDYWRDRMLVRIFRFVTMLASQR
jgi:plasmid stabilization system protein ParE